MENIFKSILKGKVAIIGIGNILRADDGFGPALIERLKGKTRAVCIDAGTAPENYIGKIVRERPDTVIIADAVHLELAPGDYMVMDRAQILKTGFTTHDISPAIFIERLRQDTDAAIYMLGVQPAAVTFGSGISIEVQKAIEDITGLITEAEDARDAYNRAHNKRDC